MFEPILLKKMMYSGEFFSKIINVLDSKHFVNAGNIKLYQLIKAYYIDYKNIPTVTEIVAQVKDVPNTELRTAIIEQLQIISKTEEVQNTEFMLEQTVKFIKNAIFTEALILGSDAIAEKSEDKTAASKALMEEMSKVSIDSDLGLDFTDIETMIEYYQNKLVGILTQHTEFNKRLGTGFLPGTLSVIAAASGVGKSLLMTDLISHNIKDGKNVLLVSMEMQDREIMKRVHANALDLPINNLTTLDPEVIRNAHTKFTNAGNKIGEFHVKDYPVGTFSPMMLDTLLDNFKIEKGIEFDLVYLDYLGIMKSDLVTPAAGLYSYVKSIVEETRAVASKRKLPIVSASQLGRAAIGTTTAQNDTISDSIGTVQTADFILFLLQTEQMKAENLITAKCTKNRFNGRTDTWDINVDYEHMRFTDAVVQGTGMSTKEAENIIFDQQMEDIKTINRVDKKLQEPLKEHFDIMGELGL